MSIKQNSVTMRNTVLFLFGMLLLVGQSFAQMETGEIRGQVLDSITEKPLIFANVMLYQDEVLAIGTACDLKGEYQFLTVDPGVYDLEISLIGYQKKILREVKVKADKVTWNDVYAQEEQFMICCCFTQLVFDKPLFEVDNASTEFIYSRNELQNSPVRW